MTGPEHYREAERLLTEHEYESSADALAAAQVHATLALAAASAEPILKPLYADGGPIARAWSEAIS